MSEIRLTTGKCLYFKNSFCYVCGNFVETNEKRVKIDDRIKNSFRYCFSSDIVLDASDRGFRPDIVCNDCEFSMHYSQKHKKKHKYECPVEWKKPMDDHENCYFCLYKNGESVGSTTMVKPVPRQKTVRNSEKPAKISVMLDDINSKHHNTFKPICMTDPAKRQFCYVCARSIQETRKQCSITDGIKKSYVHCFSKNIIQDDYRPDIVCSECKGSMQLSRAINGKHKFERPAVWRKPDEEHKNCYFCHPDQEVDTSTMTGPVYRTPNKANRIAENGALSGKAAKSVAIKKKNQAIKQVKRKPGRPRKNAVQNGDQADRPLESRSAGESDSPSAGDESVANGVCDSSELKSEALKLGVAVSCPTLNVQKDLDELAINLSILQRQDEEFMIFRCDAVRLEDDRCRVALKRIPMRQFEALTKKSESEHVPDESDGKKSEDEYQADDERVTASDKSDTDRSEETESAIEQSEEERDEHQMDVDEQPIECDESDTEPEDEQSGGQKSENEQSGDQKSENEQSGGQPSKSDQSDGQQTESKASDQLVKGRLEVKRSEQQMEIEQLAESNEPNAKRLKGEQSSSQQSEDKQCDDRPSEIEQSGNQKSEIELSNSHPPKIEQSVGKQPEIEQSDGQQTESEASDQLVNGQLKVERPEQMEIEQSADATDAKRSSDEPSSDQPPKGERTENAMEVGELAGDAKSDAERSKGEQSSDDVASDDVAKDEQSNCELPNGELANDELANGQMEVEEAESGEPKQSDELDEGSDKNQVSYNQPKNESAGRESRDEAKESLDADRLADQTNPAELVNGQDH